MDIQLSDEVSQAYLSEVEDILKNKEFLSLSLYEHHQWTNRLMYSINVSYISWKLAKKLGCDAAVAARAGLLHDFCPYDFRQKTPTGEHQAFYHPKAAADNSARTFDISEKEWNAILTHMFPLGPVPKNREIEKGRCCFCGSGFSVHSTAFRQCGESGARKDSVY